GQPEMAGGEAAAVGCGRRLCPGFARLECVASRTARGRARAGGIRLWGTGGGLEQTPLAAPFHPPGAAAAISLTHLATAPGLAVSVRAAAALGNTFLAAASLTFRARSGFNLLTTQKGEQASDRAGDRPAHTTTRADDSGDEIKAVVIHGEA